MLLEAFVLQNTFILNISRIGYPAAGGHAESKWHHFLKTI